jgi:hypothetical protein
MSVNITVRENGAHTSHGVNDRVLRQISNRLTVWLLACNVVGDLSAVIVRGTPDGHLHQSNKAIRYSQYSVYVRVCGCFLSIVVPSSLGMDASSLFRVMCETNDQEVVCSNEGGEAEPTEQELSLGRELYASEGLNDFLCGLAQHARPYYGADMLMLAYFYFVGEREDGGWIDATRDCNIFEPKMGKLLPERFEQMRRKGMIEVDNGLVHRNGDAPRRFKLADKTVAEIRRCIHAEKERVKLAEAAAAQALEAEAERQRQERERRRELLDERVKSTRESFQQAIDAHRRAEAELVAVQQRISSATAEIATLEVRLRQLRTQVAHDKGQVLTRVTGARNRTHKEVERIRQRLAPLESQLLEV